MRSSTLLLLSILLASCATTGGSAVKVGPDVADDKESPVSSAAKEKHEEIPPQESLLELVPASARAMMVLRKGLFRLPLRWLGRSAEMKRELGRFLQRTIGVDLTRAEGVVGYAMRLAPKPSFALLLRIPGHRQAGRLKGQPAGRYRGVPLVEVFAAPGTGGTIVATSLPEGVVLGTADGVETAIDLSQKKTAALDPKAPLGDALHLDGKAVDALIALHASASPQMAPTAQRFGVDLAAMTLDRKGGLVLRVTGDPDKLQMALGFIRASMSAALSGLEQKMNKAAQGNDIPAGVVSIVSFYQARELIAELDPQFDGAGLVSRYGLPEVDLSAGLVAYAGVLAAVAIPAFIKYIRKSKTVEATESLDKIKAGLKAHYLDRGKRRRNRYRFPKSTPWTPAVSCCKAASSPKCTPTPKTFDHPSWTAVHFQLSDPHYYQYRITSEGRGKKARVTVEAQGDLDCDGVLSNYQIIGAFDDNWHLVFKGPIITNEIE